ncbi:MAG: helix-turn-helix domain-containing protein [Selenomonadaceae bacterium]|nr:helix-turn-helix domain-containing protein [Selenomonadaceae bacterium]
MIAWKKTVSEKRCVNGRTELSLTQREVAIFVGVTEATVSRWESGDIDNMRRDKIARLAEVLRVSPLLIMGDENCDRTYVPPTAEELDLLEKWRTLELGDKEIIRGLINRLRLLARNTRNSSANSVVTQKKYNGNNYFDINGGNFNSNVSAQ